MAQSARSLFRAAQKPAASQSARDSARASDPPATPPRGSGATPDAAGKRLARQDSRRESVQINGFTPVPLLRIPYPLSQHASAHGAAPPTLPPPLPPRVKLLESKHGAALPEQRRSCVSSGRAQELPLREPSAYWLGRQRCRCTP